jgi:hypothetical protein
LKRGSADSPPSFIGGLQSKADTSRIHWIFLEKKELAARRPYRRRKSLTGFVGVLAVVLEVEEGV